MPYNRQSLIEQAQAILGVTGREDGTEPAEALFLAHVKGAITWLSRFEPREVRSTLAGDGTTYQFAVPSTWTTGLSRLVSLEYPIGEQRRRYYDLRPRGGNERPIELYPIDTAPTYFHFPVWAPASGSSAAVVFTSIHTIDDSSTTVPAQREAVLENLLAHLVAKGWAAQMGYSTSPTIEADSVNYGGKGAEWMTRAKDCLETASNEFGTDLSAKTWGGFDRMGRI